MRRVLFVLLCVAAVAAHPAPASASHSLSKIAVAGDSAPGTGGTQANSFLSVSINDAGDVGFVNTVDNGSVVWGAFRGAPGTIAAASLAGDSAPDTGGGTYSFPGGFTGLDAAGGLSFGAVVIGGSANVGIFADDAGTDSSVVIVGETAPDTGGGTFAGGVGLLNSHSANMSGTVVFADDVIGGSVTHGLFTSVAGAVASVALVGDAAPGAGAATFASFLTPSINAGDDVAVVAALTGGSVTSGVFLLPSGLAGSAIALAGDPAPGTGGATFTDFAYPVVNAAGAVTFIANTSGGTATGGVFLYDGGSLVPIIVDGDAAPTVGGTFSGVTSYAPISDTGLAAFPALISGGSAGAAIFVFDDSTAGLDLVVAAGTQAPDAGAANFSGFGFVAVNSGGDVAFQSTLSDTNKGLFLAAAAPALPVFTVWGQLLTGLAIGATGWVGSRRQR